MRKRHLLIVLLAFVCSPALAAEPVGEWMVADGGAQIRIEPCADALWGVISWTREPGVDGNNPDPAKRTRSIVGVPILRNMKLVSPNRWEGEVYNAENGKMYSANIALVSDDVLKIQGCVFGGLFCGGENWTRVQPVKTATPAAPAAPAKKTPPAAKTQPQAQPQPPTAAACPVD
jgi:uncharacterized protein (DUF2147 family)